MIEDYYKDLEVLQNNQLENELGKYDNWETMFVCQGIINPNSGSDIVNGKVIVIDKYKAFTEVTDDTKTITSANRLKQDGKIYKILGNPRNTMGLDHHFVMDCEYTDISQE